MPIVNNRVVRVDLSRREEYYAGLDRLVRRIRAELPATAIYLFGSFARGNIHEGSDMDLLIVGDFNDRFHERSYRVLQLNSENLPIEPLCYTPQELERMQAEGNPFIAEALRTAKRLV